MFLFEEKKVADNHISSRIPVGLHYLFGDVLSMKCLLGCWMNCFYLNLSKNFIKCQQKWSSTQLLQWFKCSRKQFIEHVVRSNNCLQRFWRKNIEDCYLLQYIIVQHSSNNNVLVYDTSTWYVFFPFYIENHC
jgi:hypothetical protein